jgi:hypothetical protein
MGEFTYTTVPGKIKPLLDKLRQVGTPPKATAQWLKTIGFTSSNDSTLLGVLKTIGLIDSSGVPTGRWSNYRGANHKKVLAEAIRGGLWRDDLDASGPTINLRRDRSVWIMFLLIASCNS